MFYDLYLDLCKRKGTSPTRAALEIGISKSTPTTWKNRGLTPQGETLSKIADYFNVSVGYLLGTEKEKAPTPEDEREIDDETLKAAFWGGEKDLSSEELDALWEDVREYARYKAEQRRKKKHE